MSAFSRSVLSRQRSALRTSSSTAWQPPAPPTPVVLPLDDGVASRGPRTRPLRADALWLDAAEAWAAHYALQRAVVAERRGLFGHTRYDVRILPQGYATFSVRATARGRHWRCPCTWGRFGLACEHVGAASLLHRARLALSAAVTEGLCSAHVWWPQAVDTTHTDFLVRRAPTDYTVARVLYDTARAAVTHCAHDGPSCGDLPVCAHAGAVLMRTGAWLSASERKERWA